MSSQFEKDLEALLVSMLDNHGNMMRLLDRVEARMREHADERNRRFSDILAVHDAGALETERLLQILAARIGRLPAAPPRPPRMEWPQQGAIQNQHPTRLDNFLN